MMNTTNYKRMFVLSEDEYMGYKRYKATLAPAAHDTSVKCPVCGRDYPNENIMAHHLKSHVNGFKCNICGEVYTSKQSLTLHLKQHAPQVEPSKQSVLDNNMPNQPLHDAAPPMHISVSPMHHTKPHVHEATPRKKHKQKSVINFTVKKWLTL